jgi:hypothetical protein
MYTDFELDSMKEQLDELILKQNGDLLHLRKELENLEVLHEKWFQGEISRDELTKNCDNLHPNLWEWSLDFDLVLEEIDYLISCK